MRFHAPGPFPQQKSRFETAICEEQSAPVPIALSNSAITLARIPHPSHLGFWVSFRFQFGSAMATSTDRRTASSSSSLQSTNIFSHQRRSPLPFNASLIPILSSCYLKPSLGASSFGMRAWLSSGPEVKNYKLPPPVNPPDAENPDKATLRAQWDSEL